MARAKKTAITGEVLPPDFDEAIKVYDNDVAPANKAQKSAMADASEAWKVIKKEHRVHVGGFRTALNVAKMESADQQGFLRSFAAGLKRKGVFLYTDLADRAAGVNSDIMEIIGTGEEPMTDMIDAD